MLPLSPPAKRFLKSRLVMQAAFPISLGQRSSASSPIGSAPAGQGRPRCCRMDAERAGVCANALKVRWQLLTASRVEGRKPAAERC